MGKLFFKACSLLLIFVLLAGASQVNAAALLEDEGTEANEGQYKKVFKARCTDEDFSIVGNYSLRYISSGHSGQVYRAISSSFLWSEFDNLTVWTYRPSGYFDDQQASIYIVFRESASYFDDGMKGRIKVGADPENAWVQHRLEKADFINYNGGLSDKAEINFMAWDTGSYFIDPDDYVYLDGLDINPEPEPEPESGGGFCLGTVAVSIIAVIALVAIGVKSNKKLS